MDRSCSTQASSNQIPLSVTKGFNQPWSMAFLPDGAILVTELLGQDGILRGGW